MKQCIKIIDAKEAPKAIGPYSQAIKVDVTNSELLFVSGQLPVDKTTGQLIEGSIEEIIGQVFDNIEVILKAANSTFEDVVRMDIFLIDFNIFQQVNEECKKRFAHGNFPARQTIQVVKLPLGAALEISCIAAVPQARKI